VEAGLGKDAIVQVFLHRETVSDLPACTRRRTSNRFRRRFPPPCTISRRQSRTVTCSRGRAASCGRWTSGWHGSGNAIDF
jgi:hypothetical protein